jgi:hypothetical protein
MAAVRCLYVLGVLVAEKGWAERMPPGLGRRCGIAVAGTIAAALVIMAVTGVVNLSQDDVPFLGGWHWQALALDVVEATLVVAGSVWLLALAQRWFTHRATALTRWSRGAYAAYLLQAPVLISLEIAARSLPWPAVIKAVIIAGARRPGILWSRLVRYRADPTSAVRRLLIAISAAATMSSAASTTMRPLNPIGS